MADVTEVSIPSGRLLSPSPDGALLAVIDRDGRLCVLRLPALDEVGCGTFPPGHEGHVDGQAVSWSPDSARLTVHESLFLFLEESDIWTMEVASGEFLNLTDDGFSGGALASDTADLDVITAWSPDGSRLAFSRGFSPETGSELMLIEPDGGQPPVSVGTVTDEGTTLSYGIRWLADARSVVFSAFSNPRSDDSGIWIVDTGDGSPTQLLGPDEERGPPSLAGVSADDRHALVMYREVLNLRGEPDVAGYELLRLDDRQLQPIAPPDTDPATLRGAAFSPDGSQIAYTYLSAPRTFSLAVADIAGSSEQVLLDRDEPMRDLDIGYQLAWPTPEVLYVPVTATSALLVELTYGP